MPSFGSIVCLTVRRSDAFLNGLFPLKEAVTKQIVIILPVKVSSYYWNNGQWVLGMRVLGYSVSWIISINHNIASINHNIAFSNGKY